MERFSVRARLLLGSRLVPGAVVIEGSRIAEVLREAADGNLAQPILHSDILAPGFIDLQVNGGFGADVGDDPEAIRALARLLPRTGVTGFLPTLITSPAEYYPRAFHAFEAGRSAGGACPLGLHLEGPFLSPQRSGAHPRHLIEAADPGLIDTLLEADGLRLLTLAPERQGALDWIRKLCARHIVASLGHTNATVEEFVAGVDAGAVMATHLFNAMSPFDHRAPNVIGAALVEDRVTVGLIADGIHSHPTSLQLAVRAKGPERIALVTDMVSAAGMPPGEYQLAGRTVTLRDGAVRLPDGTLAGSALTMDVAVRNMVGWTSATPPDVLRMASEVPARLIGLERGGQLRAGWDADLVLLDGDLSVAATLIRGDWAYRRGEA